jgi:citryl-CoA synthetase large subunit
MRLYEYEGKKLFKKVGILVPASFLIQTGTRPKGLISNTSQITKIPNDSKVVKAQVLSGNRARRGGVVVCKTLDETKKTVKNLLGKKLDGEEVKKVLVEKQIEIEKEYYFSITFDTSVRAPVLLLSARGGTGISAFEKKFILDPLEGLDQKTVEGYLRESNFPKEEIKALSKILVSLAKLFFEYDCRIAEINPLAKTNGEFVALDAKIILDDAALYRHPELKFPPRTVTGQVPSKAETEAKKIDENDHRGVAGSVYFDLEGDIGILASGGGGSLVALDGILAAGGKPANYTEYSGNPPLEKVYKLTKIVLSKKGLNGLFVVGGIANFTDIYETLRGFIEALKEQKPKPEFPIVIRRAGPRDREAFEMLEKIGSDEGFNFHLFGVETPIDKAARFVVQLAQNYKNNSKIKTKNACLPGSQAKMQSKI